MVFLPESSFTSSQPHQYLSLPKRHHATEPPSTVVKFGTPQEMDRSLTAWLTLQILGGQVGIPLILITLAFSKRLVKRSPVLINLLLNFVVWSVAACLLLYAGQHKGPEPSGGLCLFQASVLYGTAPMASLATFALVFQIWRTIRTAISGGHLDQRTNLQVIILLAAPYIGLIAGTIWGVAIGSHHMETVSRTKSFFFCTIDYPLVGSVTAAMAVVALVAALVFESWAAVIIFRNWRSIWAHRGDSNRLVDLNLVIRIAVFTVYSVFGMGSGLISILDPSNPFPIFVTGTLPLIVFFNFGLQLDIIRQWMFWRRRTHNDDTSPPAPPPKEMSQAQTRRSFTTMQTATTASQETLLSDEPVTHLDGKTAGDNIV